MTPLDVFSNHAFARSTNRVLADGTASIHESIFYVIKPVDVHFNVFGADFYVSKPDIYRVVFRFELQINSDDVAFGMTEAVAIGNYSGDSSKNPYVPFFKDLYKRLTE